MSDTPARGIDPIDALPLPDDLKALLKRSAAIVLANPARFHAAANEINTKIAIGPYPAVFTMARLFSSTLEEQQTVASDRLILLSVLATYPGDLSKFGTCGEISWATVWKGKTPVQLGRDSIMPSLDDLYQAMNIRVAKLMIARLQAIPELKSETFKPTAAEANREDTTPGKGMSWKTAMAKAEAHCARNPFPGVKALARIVGCSPSTMDKAIDRSSILRAMLVEHKARHKSVSTVTMSEADAASATQSREPDPIDVASQSTDDAFHRLLQDATPEERAKLNAMTPEEQRELVAMVEHDPDRAQAVRGRSRSVRERSRR